MSPPTVLLIQRLLQVLGNVYPVVMCFFEARKSVRGIWKALTLNDPCLLASCAHLDGRFVPNICSFIINLLLHPRCSGLSSKVRSLFHLLKLAKTPFSLFCWKELELRIRVESYRFRALLLSTLD